ncbi:MAG: hypothetical protein F4Z22_12850 [Acidimicrobiia bacterium]|nr:hypothetical protein [Acidimicrobiia bacterium]
MRLKLARHVTRPREQDSGDRSGNGQEDDDDDDGLQGDTSHIGENLRALLAHDEVSGHCHERHADGE